MSQENVEIVRAATEAMLAGDLETALEAVAEDIEWHGAVGGFDEGRIARGRGEVIAGYGEYFASWENVELRAERYIDAGEEDVVVFIHESATGSASGIVVETDLTTVNTVRDKKIVRVRWFMDRAEALQAVGLRE